MLVFAHNKSVIIPHNFAMPRTYVCVTPRKCVVVVAEGVCAEIFFQDDASVVGILYFPHFSRKYNCWESWSFLLLAHILSCHYQHFLAIVTAHSMLWGPTKGPTPGLDPHLTCHDRLPFLSSHPRTPRQGCPSCQTRSCYSNCSTALEAFLLVSWGAPWRSLQNSPERDCYPDRKHMWLGLGWARPKGSIV